MSCVLFHVLKISNVFEHRLTAHSKVVLYICTCYNNIVYINAASGLLNICRHYQALLCDL